MTLATDQHTLVSIAPAGKLLNAEISLLVVITALWIFLGQNYMVLFEVVVKFSGNIDIINALYPPHSYSHIGRMWTCFNMKRIRYPDYVSQQVYIRETTHYNAIHQNQEHHKFYLKYTK